MTNHETLSSQQDNITQPVLQEPDALVENVYPLYGHGTMPDLESQDKMGEYLIERFVPDEGPRTRIVLTPSGRTMPGIQRHPTGFKQVSRFRKIRPKEWLVSPRQAAAVMVGSMALFNLVGNHKTITGGAEYTGHAVYRLFNPVGDRLLTRRTETLSPGKTNTIDLTVATSDRVGVSEVDPSAVSGFVDKVHQAEQSGDQIVSLMVTGNTSDEWSNDDSIGATDPGNSDLGHARAEAGLQALMTDGLNLPSSELVINEQEHVLSLDQKTELQSEVIAYGFPDIKSAIVAVDEGQNLSPSLTQKIKQLFTGKQNRGVSLSATIQNPGKSITSFHTKTIKIPGQDHPPIVPEPHFYGFIPMLPIRRRERYDKFKQCHRWQFTSSKPIMRPEIIREDQEQSWVRLRPEAEQADGSLVDNAWAYTRVYEHLLRDDRIKEVLRADYKNPEGQSKSLRVMFVDSSPASETIDAFQGLLTKFAAMEEGKLADRISAIFVYPSENAGIAHDDPKRIAMGLDKQSSEHILGTFTYALDLVELHMPTTWSSEQLLTMFEETNGTKWVAAHEIAGHGTDESDEQLRLRTVRVHGIPNARVIDGEPRARKMAVLDKVLSKLPNGRQAKEAPLKFDISYPVTDNNGQTVTMTARVTENDPRLAHATRSTIVGYKPTVYGSTNVSEHYAETAASVTTGIAIPYAEATVKVPQLQADSGQPATFATGYRPDARGQKVYTKSVGAQAGSFPVTFLSPPEVTISRLSPADDPLLRQELIRTRQIPTLSPHQMIAILARAARRIRQTGV